MSFSVSRRLAFGGSVGLAGLLASEAAATPWSRADRRAIEVVDALFAAYTSLDFDALEPLITEDIEFDDPTFHLRARGKAEMMEIARGLANYSDVRIDRTNVIVAAPWVVTQQSIAANTRNRAGEQRRIDVRGCSVFRVRDGQIAVWNDYYDILTFQEQMRGPSAN